MSPDLYAVPEISRVPERLQPPSRQHPTSSRPAMQTCLPFWLQEELPMQLYSGSKLERSTAEPSACIAGLPRAEVAGGALYASARCRRPVCMECATSAAHEPTSSRQQTTQLAACTLNEVVGKTCAVLVYVLTKVKVTDASHVPICESTLQRASCQASCHSAAAQHGKSR